MAGDDLDKFIDEIITTKNLSGLTDEVRAQLISDMKETLLDQINRALVDSMPDDKIDEFNNLLDSSSTDEEIQRFIEQSGVDVKGVTVQAMLLFRDLYLEPAQNSQGE